MSAEKAKELFQSSQVALECGDLEQALNQAKLGLDVCQAGDGEVHAALLDLQASVETEIKKQERSNAKNRADSKRVREVSVRSKSAKQFAQSHVRPSLRLHLDASSDAAAPHSRVGGCPSVPKDFVWPRREDGRSLAFLCQINMAELQDFEFVHKLLPKSGILSFFYDVEDKPSGLDSGDRHGWCVYYFAKQIKVNPFERPEGHDIAPHHVHFMEEPSYPDPVSDETEELDRVDYADYDRFVDASYEERPYHRLLGHPQLSLGDFYEECEIATRGIDWHIVRNDPYLAEEIQVASKRWITLLQLDSDERVGFMWGDKGRIYFSIEEESLKHHDFSNVWLIMQCT